MVAHADMANALRFLSMDAVQQANSGHPGMPMGMADVATVLFTRFLSYDPSAPEWADRDRFVLSAGHGSMLMYSLLYLTGYPEIDMNDLKNFRQLGAKTAGHPEYGHLPGIETTTGPLGQGITNAVGMALAEQMLSARFGADVVNHRTYTIVGDGCLMEGISQEAISLAGHLRLSKLTVLWDDNEITIDGHTSVATSEDQAKRFEACGWSVFACDGHDPEAIAAAIEAANASDKPSMIACDTKIGKGAPNKEGTSACHGAPLGEDEIAACREVLGWDHEPFVLPEDVLAAWRSASTEGKGAHAAWQKRLDALPADQKDLFIRTMKGELAADWNEAIVAHRKKMVADAPCVATRKSSEMALSVLVPSMKELIGGSADLTGSNLTRPGGKEAMPSVTKEDYSGTYINYGVREHAMAAVMNGIALHGGFVPYGGTFFVFSDYLRPAVRLAALMEKRVIHVLTHDSIGVGEDGPTHQPVEHLASFRAMPNVRMFRPCDAVETAETWELSIAHDKGPSLLALTRQNLPVLRQSADENKTAKGGYVISDCDGPRQVTLMASGSEVSAMVEAQKELAEKGVQAAVVSMPCMELFNEQPVSYREEVLGKDVLRVAMEAAVPFGWERYVGLDGIVIGMNGFGASGPGGELFTHFGLTADNVVQSVMKKL